MDVTVVKVENEYDNQVVVKKEKFKLHFTKFDEATIVKDDQSIEDTHNTINVDKFRMNSREKKSLLSNFMCMVGLSNNKHSTVVLGNCQIRTSCLGYFGPRM